jgi:hypothetical protein
MAKCPPSASYNEAAREIRIATAKGVLGEETAMIDLVRPRFTLNTMMLLVAISATCFAVFAFSGNFHMVKSPSSAIIATMAWSLATALPALWVGAAWKYPPRDVLFRFGIGNGIFAILLGAKFEPVVSIVALVIAILVPSLGWYAWSQMLPGEDRDRLKGYRRHFAPYLFQFIATVVTLIAASAVMEKSL